MATKLIDKVKKQEEQENNNENGTLRNDTGEARKNKNSVLHNISSKDGFKDKQISAKVNGNMYATFSAINKAQGISNNSAINMIITKYVRENKAILDEE
jgi:hypothetical protein